MLVFIGSEILPDYYAIVLVVGTTFRQYGRGLIDKYHIVYVYTCYILGSLYTKPIPTVRELRHQRNVIIFLVNMLQV